MKSKSDMKNQSRWIIIWEYLRAWSNVSKRENNHSFLNTVSSDCFLHFSVVQQTLKFLDPVSAVEVFSRIYKFPINSEVLWAFWNRNSAMKKYRQSVESTLTSQLLLSLWSTEFTAKGLSPFSQKSCAFKEELIPSFKTKLLKCDLHPLIWFEWVFTVIFMILLTVSCYQIFLLLLL